LSLEYNEFTAFLGIKIHDSILVPFKGVDNLVELILAKEESIVSLGDALCNFLNRHAECFLVEVIFE
jgi:hypothetical protein